MEKKRNAKGEGSFTINPDGTVTHRKSVGYKANGNRKILTVTAATKTACMRKMKKKEADWEKKKSAEHVKLKDTVVELCMKHLQYQIDNDDLKPKSIDRRECTIINQIEKYDIGKMQVHSVTSADVEKHILALIREGKLSESSIVKVLDVLNASYEWAFLLGELENNPVKIVKEKLAKKLKRLSEKNAEEADVAVLSDIEIEKFTREALKVDIYGNPVYPAGDYLLLLLYTGMRCGEMIALRWNRVDLDSGILTIKNNASMAKNRKKTAVDDNNFVMVEGSTKNQKARMIQLNEDAIQTLERIYKRGKNVSPDALITPTLSGAMNTASNLEHRLRVILKNAGLEDVKGGLHILRKSCATKMYEAGARVEEIAAYIGDLESTTRKYYIAIRKKVITKDGTKQIIKLPETKKSLNQ